MATHNRQVTLSPLPASRVATIDTSAGGLFPTYEEKQIKQLLRTHQAVITAERIKSEFASDQLVRMHEVGLEIRLATMDRMLAQLQVRHSPQGQAIARAMVEQAVLDQDRDVRAAMQRGADKIGQVLDGTLYPEPQQRGWFRR